MKAIITTKYGNPDVLQLKEVEKPNPKDNEVLIKVYSAIAGPADCALRKGDPFIVKIMYGLTKPKLPIGGVEFAGEIEAVGKDVTLFKPGDQVFGMSPNTFGAYAEYMCLPETGSFIVTSANMSYIDAVGLCDGAPTALTFLRDTAIVQPGMKVLINGASGSVGAYAVQIASYFGAEVTGVCSSSNIDLVRSLGAKHVIDYTKEDFTRNGKIYDIIFDAVAKRSFSQCKNSLTPKGTYLTTFPSLAILFQMLWTKVTNKKAMFTASGLRQSKENLVFIKELFETKRLKSVIDRIYPLEEISQAHAYVETGHKKGNVVIELRK